MEERFLQIKMDRTLSKENQRRLLVRATNDLTSHFEQETVSWWDGYLARRVYFYYCQVKIAPVFYKVWIDQVKPVLFEIFGIDVGVMILKILIKVGKRDVIHSQISENDIEIMRQWRDYNGLPLDENRKVMYQSKLHIVERHEWNLSHFF